MANKHGDAKGQTVGKLGGTNKMHGWSGTGTQQPGQSAQEGSGSKTGIAPKAGGQVGFYSDNSKHGKAMSKHGTNTDYAGTREAGTTSPNKTGGNKDGFAKGGTTSMFGNRGSIQAIPGKSSP
jgi:hypothetical protein